VRSIAPGSGPPAAQMRSALAASAKPAMSKARRRTDCQLQAHKEQLDYPVAVNEWRKIKDQG
jgi:hypothetical protein